MKNECIRLVGGIENVLPLHPLINPNSPHYDVGGKTAIEELEERLTVIEMIGFCKANIMKYEYRKAHKGQSESDEVKINTYNNYILALIGMDILSRDATVEFAFKRNGLKWRYR